MKLSLRNKFLVPTLMIIIIGMAVSGLVGYTYSFRSYEEAMTDQVRQIVSSLDALVSSWMKDRKTDIETWSKQKIFISALQDSFSHETERNAVNGELAFLKERYPYYEDILLGDAEGNVVGASNPEFIGKTNLKERQYYQDSLQGNVAVSSVIKSKLSGNPVFVVSAPIREKDSMEGVLVGIIDISQFGEMFTDGIKIGDTGYAYIYQNHDGLVVAHPHKKNILQTNMNKFDFGQKMMKQGSGVITYTYEGVEKVVAFKKVEGTDWTVAAGVPTRELLAHAKRIGYINIVVALGVVVLAAFVVFLVARSIVRPINRISKALWDSAAQVAIASGQVAASSQKLAEGSSEQASSIEATSSSLEEMSSMTRQNSENAGQADSLMKEETRIVARADEVMNELTAAMEDISKAGEETSKIIKTIDEIAFQTNLLALNAAVEAARAGEAGAGFAVVADEVRNLAMRAADAAKSTSSLIEGTVKKVKDGTELVNKANHAFFEVSQSASRVGELVGEIAAASNEQAQGIDQASKTVTEMDKFTRKNAANAEETASASEEMSAQAEQMKGNVDQLKALVGGNGRKSSFVRESAPRRKRMESRTMKNLTAAAPPRAHGKQKTNSVTKEIRPTEVIPLNDEDFKDF